MNIFQNRDIFFGKSNFINIHSHMNKFWKLAKEIKAELGNQKYYLDGYINVIFKTLTDMDLGTASAIADNICSNILRDCYVIMGENEREDKEKSKFFDMVQKYIEQHPVNFKWNHTKSEFYAANIIIDNLEPLYQEFKKRYKAEVLSGIDYPSASEYYKKIASIIDEEKMERFNDIIAESFIFGPIGISELQHFMVYTVGMFVYRDPESSKQIYQLMMRGK